MLSRICAGGAAYRTRFMGPFLGRGFETESWAKFGSGNGVHQQLVDTVFGQVSFSKNGP
jgi:hypothetical protein